MTGRPAWSYQRTSVTAVFPLMGFWNVTAKADQSVPGIDATSMLSPP